MKKKFLYQGMIIKQKKENIIEKIINIFDESYNIKNKKKYLIKKSNQIKIEYQVDDDDEEEEEEEKIKIFGKKFVRNNKNKCYILYEGKKNNLVEFFNVGNNLKKSIIIKLIEINSFINLEHMFNKCEYITLIRNIDKLNINKVNNISYLFSDCSSLEYLPVLSNWNTSNVIDMRNLFYNCESLEYLPDISKWNTNKVKYMSYLFYGCSSLEYLPDLSNWNTSNIVDMSI